MELTFNPYVIREVYHVLELIREALTDSSGGYSEYCFNYDLKIRHKDWVGYDKDGTTPLYMWGEWKNIPNKEEVL